MTSRKDKIIDTALGRKSDGMSIFTIILIISLAFTIVPWGPKKQWNGEYETLLNTDGGATLLATTSVYGQRGETIWSGLGIKFLDINHWWYRHRVMALNCGKATRIRMVYDSWQGKHVDAEYTCLTGLSYAVPKSSEAIVLVEGNTDVDALDINGLLINDEKTTEIKRDY